MLWRWTEDTIFRIQKVRCHCIVTVHPSATLNLLVAAADATNDVRRGRWESSPPLSDWLQPVNGQRPYPWMKHPWYSGGIGKGAEWDSHRGNV